MIRSKEKRTIYSYKIDIGLKTEGGVLMRLSDIVYGTCSQ